MISKEMKKAGREVLFKHQPINVTLTAMADKCVVDIYEAMQAEKLKQGLDAYWAKVAEDPDHYSNR